MREGGGRESEDGGAAIFVLLVGACTFVWCAKI